MKQQRINSLCNRSFASVFWGHNFKNDNDHRFCIAHMLICVVIYTDLYVAPMARNSDVLVPAVSDVCQGNFAYTLLQFFQMTIVYNVVYSRHTVHVHCKEPLKSFDKSRA